MKLYLTISTFIGVFLEGLFVTLHPFSGFSFDLKPGILIILMNSIILLLSGRIWIKLWQILLFIYLATTSYFLMAGYESLFIKQLVLITVFIIYFYNFIRYVGAEIVFNMYVKSAYYYSIFALLYYFAEIWFGMPYFNFMPSQISAIANGSLHGLMAEQSVYCILMMPALYYSAVNRNQFGLKVPIFIFVTIILTGSAMGIVGIILSLLFLLRVPFRVAATIILILFILIVSFLFTKKDVNGLQINPKQTIHYCFSNCSENKEQQFNHHPYIHFGFANPTKPIEWSNEVAIIKKDIDKILEDRILLSFKSFKNEWLPDVNVDNVSSYTLISNLLVAKKVIGNSPILGGGLGSHPINYDRYILTIDGAGPWIRGNVILGRLDANSLGTRIISELGLMGLIFISLFFLKTYKGIDENNLRLVYSIYIYLILVLIRSGTYGSLDLFLFIFILYFSTIEKITKNEK